MSQSTQRPIDQMMMEERAPTPVETQYATGAIAPPLLLQYWQTILRWKWVILGIILSCLTAGLIATMLMTPQYTAQTRIEITREQKNITNVEGLESPAAAQEMEFYQTQYNLLQTRSLAERVARKLRLTGDQAFLDAHDIDSGSGGFFADKKATGASVRNALEKEVVDTLLDNIGIDEVRGSRLVDVSYTSASPSVSQKISDAWAKQYIESSMDRRFESTADARTFLETRLADLRAKLEQSERDAANYAVQKGIVALSTTKGADGRTQTDRTVVSSDLEELNTELSKATADRIAMQARVPTASGSSQEMLSNTTVTSLRQKRAEVAAEYAKLMVVFEPGYPAARALAEQLRVLDTNIKREESRISGSETSSRQNAYNEALRREQNLTSRVEMLKAQMNNQQQDNIQLNIYQREADTNRQLYDSLLQRFKEIGVAGVGSNNIAIVDTAVLPVKPSSPNLPFNLALALLAGLVLAAVATFALDQIDEGLREPSQVTRLLQTPLLGSIPDLEDTEVLAELRDPKSEISEAYLSVRSNLAFSTTHGVPRSFMVTSTRPAEGKSTTSLALAAVLGRTGKKVLLLDGDMRSPSVHAMLGLPNKLGLSNFLAGETDWRKGAVETAYKGVDMLPAGPMPPSAAELLSSDRMQQLVREFLEYYDHVLIDAPPILGLADAPLLSRAVEGCVYVIEADGVAVRGIRASLERLRSVQAHVFGVVLTKLEQRQAGYGYGYGYSYGYGDRTLAGQDS